MKITRRFTKPKTDVFSTVQWEPRDSRISNPDGSIVFEMKNAEMPSSWSQLATDIMVSKYFRKAGVPQTDANGQAMRDENGSIVTGPEKSARQVIHRLAGCWRHWGETHGYFDTAEDAQAFYDELCHMMIHQQCAPNSPQWFNTGLNFAYGITGPAQGHLYCDPRTGELKKSSNAYEHPQPHACFIQSVADDLVNSGGIMDLWTREARLFKYGSGTGSNFSRVRGENEKLSGGGRSSGLMSFLKIGDRAAGAIKSGGTTRRAAKMVCLDLDHPDIEQFVNWKVREELKVAALVEGFKVLPKDQQELAGKLGLKLDYDFNGEAYFTVSGQNSNNSVRIPNRFFKAIEEDGEWNLTGRINGKVTKTMKARELWEQIAFAAWRCADPGVQYDDTINQWHTCPKSGRINASNPCVTGDTRVLTPGGIWRRIDQMIHLPARVCTNVKGQEIHVVDGAFPTGTKDVYELKTAGGYTLKLTADHKVWTKGRGWVEAKSLTSDDEVKLPSEPACVVEIGEPQDAKFFQLAGLLASEANSDVSALHLDRVGCEEHIDGFVDYVNETWESIEPSREFAADGTPTLTKTVTNRRLLSRLRAFVKTDSTGRRLSDDAFTAGLAAQRHLLRALFSADGETRGRGFQPLRKNERDSVSVLPKVFAQGLEAPATLTLSSSSSGLLEDVQTLLLGFGVRSTRAENFLSVSDDNLARFVEHIGLLDSDEPVASDRPNGTSSENYDFVKSLTHLGAEQVFDLTEPVTHSFIANGLTVHNCSEYMFLDDTACNLASLNVLTFFDAEHRKFDFEGFRHGARIWTIVLEISVLMASFPSEEIARLSYRFRTLGLGYANLGAMLMQAGIPYDSDKGRAICGAISAILTGESYATSAEMAKELGAFPGYVDNREDMLRVMRNHRRAAYDVAHNDTARRGLGDYEALDTHPVGINEAQFAANDPLASRHLLQAARECWDRALFLGEQFGYRNAQSTVIAPTGTIGLLMDCDTTGVEPDFALVKFKKLAGGGYFKIANQSLRPSLVNLGYSTNETYEIITFVTGSMSLHGAPDISYENLITKGFTEAELAKIETTLPGTFELSFAFSAWSLGEDFFKRMEIPADIWQKPGFNLLRHLGFSKKQIDRANDHVCGRGTVEGAPHLRVEHYPVFDCANKCGKSGQRFIAYTGHIHMMAAAQPFISGAISKTINLPNEATLDEIKQAYELSWKLGLKANALYRDGSKLSQPLNVKSDKELDEVEEDDEANVEAAREEIANDVLTGVTTSVVMPATSPSVKSSDNLAPMQPVHTHIVEKIVERVVERPLRRRLPDTRHALTHKFDVAGHEGYITTGLYEDGQPGEVFITMAKEGSTIGGLMDCIATLVSVALQYGVPVESLVRKFEHVRFEPSGMTRNPEVPFAKSLVDYIFRWLAMEFVPGYRAANAPARPKKAGPVDDESAPRLGATAASSMRLGTTETSESLSKPTNGHGPRIDPLASSSNTASTVAPNLRMVIVADPLSQQGTTMQSDAPACDVCGSITVRSGTCYKCQNCGNSMGCS